MPEFDTPEPISVVIELAMAEVRVSASDRVDTVVEVRPSDPSRPADVTAADQVRVEYGGGTLRVKATGRWRSWSPFGYGGSVEVDIALPTGSHLKGSAVGQIRCSGAVGDCQLKTSLGDINVEDAGAVTLSTSAGDIDLGRASRDAELVTASGEIRAGEIDGAAEIKNSNGDIRAEEVMGDLRVNAANGDIVIERVRGALSAKTANGDIRVGAVGTGTVAAATGLGSVEIGVPDGIAAWLDLHTGYGQLHSALEASGPPGPRDRTVEIRARSGYGDITIRRAYPDGGLDSPA